jgi:hypothetical protein
MAIIGSVFALLGRFAGRLVNALLGWATLLLFGRVEARKQTVLGFVALASLAWVAAGVGILVPDVGTFLVAAVPRPDFISEDVVRMGMLAAVLAIPLGVGITGVWLVEGGSRPRGVGVIGAVLRGYPFTALLAVMIAFLGIIAGMRKVRSLARRWTDAHVPLIVRPGAYDRVVEDLEDVLTGSGIDIRRKPAPDVLLLPARLLDRVAGRALGSIVPDKLILLVGPGLEILVYPTDVAISGEKTNVARSRAAIASHITSAPAWMTISAEAQAIEDAIERLAHAPPSAYRAAALATLDRRLATAIISFEEWETLYRMRLQLQHVPGDAAVDRDEPTARPAVPPAPVFERLAGLGYAATVLALLILDVLLLMTSRRADHPGRPRRLDKR